jgi:tetratricopeptide (TPR) repeat protein
VSSLASAITTHSAGEALRQGFRGSPGVPVDRCVLFVRCALPAIVVCVLLVPVYASAQSPETRDQSPETSDQSPDISAAAARTTDAKIAFVTALRRFVEAMSGMYGDEGPPLRKATADMAAALQHWDVAIKRYRDVLQTASGAEAHLALGVAYFDRGLIADAADQFRRAVTLAPRWGEASLLSALANEAVGKRDDSAQALTRAARAAPGSPAIGYARVQHAVAARDEAEVSRLLLEFRDHHDRSDRAKPGSAPFVRLGLLRESAGVAPVFAPALYAEGFRLLNLRRYREAVVALQSAVDRDPLATDDVHLDTRVRAGAELRDGRRAPAIARLEQAVERWPDATELRRVLAVAYAADERYAQGVEQLTRAMQHNAGDERSRLTMAEIMLVTGQPAAAERALKDTVTVLPDSGQGYFRLGRLYQSQSRMPEALAAFVASTARAVLVGRDSLFETLASLRVSEGEFAGAIAAYRLELDANPNNVAAHRRLGDLYAQEGRLGEALAEFAAALLIDPNDADAHASRAQTLLRLSRVGDAEAAARKAVVLNPAYEAAWYALGTALMRLDRRDEGLLALQEYERLQVAMRARNAAAWQLKLLKDQALEHAARQEFGTAADLLRRAVAYAPPDGSLHLAAGALFVKAGDFEQAIQVLKEALGREAHEAHRYLAEAYAAIGQDEQSRAHHTAYETVKAARSRRSDGR